MYNFYKEKLVQPPGCCRKLLLIMKLTALMMITAILSVSAKTLAQKVTLNEKNAPLVDVFNDINSQIGYDFVFTSSTLKNAKPVTVQINNSELIDALTRIFENQALEFSIENKIITVKAKENSSVTKAPLSQITIRGRVVDEQGDAIPGVNVKEKGTQNGIATDKFGAFQLTLMNDNATITFSFTGYETAELRASDIDPRNNIILRPSNTNLKEVVINKGYYSESQTLSVSNVSRVTAQEIEKQPINNVLLALEGKVPGLQITQSTGVSGGGVTVRIQGQNSIRSGNDPLYIIDGVPYASQLLPNIANNILRGSGGATINGVSPGAGNPLSYLNPEDIESIEVLKDADATAIYGSRAANGAILITTKKGKIGQAKVGFSIQTGVGTITKKLAVLNTPQYLEMRKEAYKNDNFAIPTSAYDINGFWDVNSNTDWQNVLVGGKAKYTDIQGSISGGTPNIQYQVGGNYHRETTVYPGDFSDRKGSIHFSLINTSPNKKFRFQLTGNYLVDGNLLPGSDLFGTATILPPDAPSLYNADGTLNWALNSTGTSTWTNPLAALNNFYRNNTTNAIANANLNYKILPGLELQSNFGYNNLGFNEFNPSTLIAVAPERRPTFTRSSNFANATTSTWIIEPQLNYSYAAGKNKITVLIGSTFQRTNNDQTQYYGQGFNSDGILEDLKSAVSVSVFNSVKSIYKYDAIYGRLNYNWDEKYLLNLTARRDGSTRFGPNNRFHNFGALGIGWNFFKESFVQKGLPFLSFGKLRGSYGTTGSDQIGDYQYMDLYNANNPGVPIQGIVGFSASRLPNAGLQWEETKKLQIGIDLGIIQDRIMFTANYVDNRSSNQLLSLPLPNFTGFGSVIANLPATVQNKAWELAISSTNLKSNSFKWTTSFNLTIPQNRLLSFPNLANTTYAGNLFVGEPVSVILAYQSAGVNPSNGAYQFLDANGKTTSSPNFSKDRTAHINTLPNFYGGLQNSVSYKNFQLDFLLQFVKQLGPNATYGKFIPGAANTNQPIYVMDRWQKSGDVAPIQAFTNFNNITPFFAVTSSDGSYSDASFIRLKNISLSWQLPAKVSHKMYFDNCRVFIHAQNLITITNYKGVDPESRNVGALPPLKVITAGLQFDLQ